MLTAAAHRIASVAENLEHVLRDVAKDERDAQVEDWKFAIRVVLAFHGFWVPAERFDWPASSPSENQFGFGSRWVRGQKGPRIAALAIMKKLLPEEAPGKSMLSYALNKSRVGENDQARFPVVVPVMESAGDSLVELLHLPSEEAAAVRAAFARCKPRTTVSDILMERLAREARDHGRCAHYRYAMHHVVAWNIARGYV